MPSLSGGCRYGCGLGLEIIDTSKGGPDTWNAVCVSVKDIIGVEEHAHSEIFKQDPKKALVAFDRAALKYFK